MPSVSREQAEGVIEMAATKFLSEISHKDVIIGGKYGCSFQELTFLILLKFLGKIMENNDKCLFDGVQQLIQSRLFL